MSSAELDELQKKMEAIRYDMDEEAQEAWSHFRDATSWKIFVRSYPWACVGAAAALGYLVVPNRLHVTSPDAGTLKKMADKNRVVVQSKPKAAAESGLAGTVLGLVASVAIRSAVGVLGQYLGSSFGPQQPSQSTTPPSEGPSNRGNFP